jgi:hypothetical protein
VFQYDSYSFEKDLFSYEFWDYFEVPYRQYVCLSFVRPIDSLFLIRDHSSSRALNQECTLPPGA